MEIKCNFIEVSKDRKSGHMIFSSFITDYNPVIGEVIKLSAHYITPLYRVIGLMTEFECGNMIKFIYLQKTDISKFDVPNYHLHANSDVYLPDETLEVIIHDETVETENSKKRKKL